MASINSIPNEPKLKEDDTLFCSIPVFQVAYFSFKELTREPQGITYSLMSLGDRFIPYEQISLNYRASLFNADSDNASI